MANVDWLDHLNNGVLYLAYALRAEEEGYPEIAAALYRIGRDKARHAAEWLNRRQPPGGSADNLRLLLRHEEATAANLSGLAGAAPRRAADPSSTPRRRIRKSALTSQIPGASVLPTGSGKPRRCGRD
jgi:hypothetical protein